MSINVEDLAFDEYLELKGEFGKEPDPHPGITVGPSKWNSMYVNKKAIELMALHNKDQLAAAPNPDAPGENELFLCKTTDGDGWSVAMHSKHAGANVSRGLISKLGEQFDAELKYEIKETGMTHPEWETPIFLAVPLDQDAEV